MRITGQERGAEGRVPRVLCICCSRFYIPVSLSGQGRPLPSASPSHVCRVSGYKKIEKKRKKGGTRVSAGSTARIPLSPLIERSRETRGRTAASGNRTCESSAIIALEGSGRAGFARVHMEDGFLPYVAITVISHTANNLPSQDVTAEYVSPWRVTRVAAK